MAHANRVVAPGVWHDPVVKVGQKDRIHYAYNLPNEKGRTTTTRGVTIYAPGFSPTHTPGVLIMTMHLQREHVGRTCARVCGHPVAGAHTPNTI